MRFLVFLLLIPFCLTATAQRPIAVRNTIGITAGFPWINNFVFYNSESGRTENKTGFGGIAASLYYKTSDKKFAVSIGVLGSGPNPFSPRYNGSDNYREIYAAYIEGTFHKRIRSNFNWLVGLRLADHSYNFIKNDSTMGSGYTEQLAGFTTGMEYLMGRKKGISVAIFYRPSILADGELKYRHGISLDLRFDLDLFYINRVKNGME